MGSSNRFPKYIVVADDEGVSGRFWVKAEGVAAKTITPADNRAYYVRLPKLKSKHKRSSS